jgi:hypothetical protein
MKAFKNLEFTGKNPEETKKIVKG